MPANPVLSSDDQFATMVNNLLKRTSVLEQRISSKTYLISGIGNNFETIVIGPAGNQIELSWGVSSPTDLVISTDTYFNETWVDVSWTEPADESAKEYEVQIARKDTTLLTYFDFQSFRTTSDNIRISPIIAGQTYGVRVLAINSVAQTSDALPISGWQDFVAAVDGTAPPAVSNVVIARGATSAIVKFDGLGADVAPDVANGAGVYEVQLSVSSIFATVDAQMRSSATVVAFNDITSPLTYYARVRAIDSSGNPGPWASSAPFTAGGVNDAMIVADLSAAKITVGLMSGDRVDVNTLNANRLKTSSLTSANITLAGGSITSGNPASNGLIMNSQGLSLYSGGTRTIFLDAISGNASFTGSISGSTFTGGVITGAVIQTALTGRRVRITSGLSTDYIAFETDHGSQISPGQIQVGGPYTEVGEQFYATHIIAPLLSGSGQRPTINIFGKRTPSGGGGEITIVADEDSFFDVSADGNYAMMQGAEYHFIKTSVSENLLWHNNGSWHTFVGGEGGSTGFVLAQFRRSSGYTDARFPGIPPSSTDALMRWSTSSGQIWYDSSSERFKEDIKPFSETYSVDLIDDLFVISYKETDKITGDIKPFDYVGLSAERTQKVAPYLVTYDTEDKPMGILYDKVSVIAIAGVQDLRSRVASLEKALEQLRR